MYHTVHTDTTGKMIMNPDIVQLRNPISATKTMWAKRMFVAVHVCKITSQTERITAR
jgi:hypothetical protein